ncbi:hypothetical protein O6H91_10G052500 [Diphasiastrum complanatum]|uniref:Uncharacterized protein n=1 Tax=Diphasiastrum complanatum TaxID=34168 RepID=A0ACC2CGX9_DIPCM|nr:hypothetical protein O6H91_10G052500 [Diphasiastrum complanatum]
MEDPQSSNQHDQCHRKLMRFVLKEGQRTDIEIQRLKEELKKQKNLGIRATNVLVSTNKELDTWKQKYNDLKEASERRLISHREGYKGQEKILDNTKVELAATETTVAMLARQLHEY